MLSVGSANIVLGFFLCAIFDSLTLPGQTHALMLGHSTSPSALHQNQMMGAVRVLPSHTGQEANQHGEMAVEAHTPKRIQG